MAHTGPVRMRAVHAAALAAALLVTSGAPALARPSATAGGTIVVGLTVPWAIGGPRIDAHGTLVAFPGEWPSIPFQSLRVWDSRTAWLDIEPRQGRFDFDRLDQFVVKSRSRGVRDISLVLGGTPRWAARQVRPADAPWMGPGSASPPRRMSDWVDFVTAVATRYRGLITSYEIWNEPNNPVFWSGSRRQWVALVKAAARAIRAVDPSAGLVASGFSMRSPGDVAKVSPWIAALGAAKVPLTAVSIHWYPDKGADLSALGPVVTDVAAEAQGAGLPGIVWISELNVRRGGSLSPEGQASAVTALTDAAREGGASRVTWYAWADLSPSDLMPLRPGTPAAQAIAALPRRLPAS